MRSLLILCALSCVARADSSTPKPAAPGAFTPDPSVERFRLPVGGAPTRGAADAKVTIVEFADFQCPFCARAETTLTQILQTWPKDVRIVWRNLPLPFHVRARPAAELALAAHAEGKFWPMHDKLFAGMRALERADLDGYAAEIGVSAAAAKSAIDDQRWESVIAADEAEAKRVDANGTPTFFLNGRQLVGAQPFDAFKKIIEEELAVADQALKAGVPRPRIYDALIAHARDHAEPRPPQTPPAEVPEDQTVYKIPNGDAPSRGAKDARVTIVEFADFQCPFCGRVEGTLARILQRYPRDVRVVWRHLPLPFHGNAHLAAEAAREAQAQGRFWELHDLLFDHQTELGRDKLEEWGVKAGLDPAKLRAALDGGKWRGAIDDDAALAALVHATGTPAFFVNGKKLSGAQPYETFQTRIEAELHRAP